MVNRSVVQSAMHTAAMALVHLPQEEWDGWVIYLCQSLGGRQEPGETNLHDDEVFQRLAVALQQRIERGTW
jgi:hypothetical protein